MKIDNIELGKENFYLISEVGANHGGDLDKCKELIKSSKECGCHAVKLQKRDNKTLFEKKLYDSPYENENSYASTYGLHREALEFNFEQYKELKEFCKTLQITFFATAFDFNSVDFLEKLGVPAYKVSSGDAKNIPLQRYMTQTGKPIIVSTGGCTYDDVQRIYDTIPHKQLVLLQCTASYPCEPENMYLLTIPEMIKRYPESIIGLSDHYIGKLMSPAAYVLGARVFEKHFTLHRWWKGTDQVFSLEPDDMKKLIRDLNNVRLAMKEGKFLQDCEKKPLYKMGKKLVTSREISVGEILTASDVKIVSPNDGLEPYELDSLLGHVVNCSLTEGDTLHWEYVE